MCVVAVLTAPEWAPEVVAGAILVGGALTVVIDQHQQDAADVGLQAYNVAQGVVTIVANAVDNSGTLYSSADLDRHLGGTYDDQKDAHHLIPENLKKNPVVVRARKLGWMFDGKENGILLPDSADAPDADKLSVHSGGHRKWNARVEQMLNDIAETAKEEGWSEDDPRWREAVEALDRQLLDDIQKEPAGKPLK